MKLKLYSLVIIILFLIAGCATPYQKVTLTTLSGGYYDDQLANGDYKVRFTGNGYTSLEQIADYAILRCSEIALENNKEFFEIIEGGAYTWNDSYNSGNTFGSLAKPEAKYIIRLLNESPPGQNSKIINALETRNRINVKYQLTP